MSRLSPTTFDETFDENKGFWVSTEDFAGKQARTVHTLRKLREVQHVAFSQKNPLIGKDKAGNIFKRSSNTPTFTCKYFYFVPYNDSEQLTKTTKCGQQSSSANRSSDGNSDEPGAKNAGTCPCQSQMLTGQHAPEIIVGNNPTEAGDTAGKPLNVKDEQLGEIVSVLKKIEDTGKDTIAAAVAKGILIEKAMSTPNRNKAIRDIQEDMLLNDGFKAVEVSRLHNPPKDDADVMNEVKVREEAKRISNRRNRNKKASKKVSRKKKNA